MIALEVSSRQVQSNGYCKVTPEDRVIVNLEIVEQEKTFE